LSQFFAGQVVDGYLPLAGPGVSFKAAEIAQKGLGCGDYIRDMVEPSHGGCKLIRGAGSWQLEKFVNVRCPTGPQFVGGEVQAECAGIDFPI